jgi:hypothetical protein
MKFRIQNLDTDDRSKYEKGQKAYFKYLERFNKSSNGDLWKFFYWDFFHDGSIESISISNDLKTVAMRIIAPNIKRFLSKGDFEYINAPFVCTFQNVVHFEIKDASPGEWFPSQTNWATFLYAEINTFPNLNKWKGEDEFYSLLIEFLVGDDTTWMELVFSQVNVEAEEPLAFSLMESDPKFEVPVYRPAKNKKARRKH